MEGVAVDREVRGEAVTGAVLESAEEERVPAVALRLVPTSAVVPSWKPFV